MHPFPPPAEMACVDACLTATCDAAPADQLHAVLVILDYAQRRARSQTPRPGVVDGVAEFERWYTMICTGVAFDDMSVDFHAVFTALQVLFEALASDLLH